MDPEKQPMKRNQKIFYAVAICVMFIYGMKAAYMIARIYEVELYAQAALMVLFPAFGIGLFLFMTKGHRW